MSCMCVNSSDSFCYICGEFMSSNCRRNINSSIKIAYKHYFWCEICVQDKPWAPHICCVRCSTRLRKFIEGKGTSMPFSVPMIWIKIGDHLEDDSDIWLVQQKDLILKSISVFNVPTWILLRGLYLTMKFFLCL